MERRGDEASESIEPEGLGKRSGEKVGLDSVLSDLGICSGSNDRSNPVGIFGKRDLNRLQGLGNTAIQPLKKTLLVDNQHEKENQMREKGANKPFGGDKDSLNSQNLGTQTSKTSPILTLGSGFVVHNTGFFVKKLLGEEPTSKPKVEKTSNKSSGLVEIRKWLEELSCVPPITKLMTEDHPDHERFKHLIQADACENLLQPTETRFSMKLPGSHHCDLQIAPVLSDQNEWHLEWTPSLNEGLIGLDEFKTETFMNAERSERIFILSVHQNPIPEPNEKPSNSEAQNATSVYLTILRIGADMTPKLTLIEYYLAY